MVISEDCQSCKWIEPTFRRQCGHPSGSCTNMERYEQQFREIGKVAREKYGNDEAGGVITTIELKEAEKNGSV